MKLPNSYGSVIKLGGKRQKPYAVRISKLVEDDTGKVKRKYTYLAYFAKPEMAYTYLAEYNSGAVVPEHMKYSDSPTFAEMYEKKDEMLPKAFKISKNECIPPVYHLCTACI